MEAEKQVRTNIDSDLHAKLQRTVRRLGMTQKAYLKEAIESKLGVFDTDMERKQLRVERDKALKARDTAQAERDHFRIKFEEKCEEVDKLEESIGNSEARANRHYVVQNILAAALGIAAVFAAYYFGIFR